MKNPCEAEKRRRRSCCFLLSSLAWQCQWSHFWAFSRLFLCWSNIYQPHFTVSGCLYFGFSFHPLNSKFWVVFWIHLSSVGSPPPKSVWAQEKSNFSSRESLLPCESSSTLQTKYLISLINWAFGGIKTSHLENVPYLANLNSTSGNLLEQRMAGVVGIEFCV